MEECNLLNIPELTFEDATHTYRLNGAEIPSVSRIMEPLSSFEYQGVDDKTLERAANRGTSVHNSIKDWLLFGIDTTNPEYRGYMDGFLDWWEFVKPVLIASEMRVYHKLFRYGGTVDLLANIDGDITLIDYKTTSRLIDKNCRVQTEGYSQALGSHGIVVKSKHILHLQSNGKWKFPEFPAKDAEAWRVFSGLKTVYDYIRS